MTITERLDYARMLNTYKGRKLGSVEYFDEKGGYIVPFNLYAKRQITYDDRLRVIKDEYFGADGEYMMLAAGYAYIEYDRRNGNVIEGERYYDTQHCSDPRQGTCPLAPFLEVLFLHNKSVAPLHLVNVRGAA